MPAESDLLNEFALQAMECVLELRLDDALTKSIDRLPHINVVDRSPWLLCYQAMERRLAHGDHRAALRLAQAATERFKQSGQIDGHARAVAEAAIDCYHMGQYATALAEIATCPPPTQPSCGAALALAEYVNHIGINTLPYAIQAAQRGLGALENEPRPSRRNVWRIVLQRNLAAAYHYQGELAAARHAVEDAVQLADAQHSNSYLYDWALYEQGLLEQRTGRLDLALEILRHARTRLEQTAVQGPVWRWIVVAEGHTLRDMGRLEGADSCYRLGGWGEGDDGPVMLWLLQGRHAEARMAVEARLVAAHASSALFEITNLTVLLALLDFEASATLAIQATLRAAVEQYKAIGFLYQRASALLHLAAIEYTLGDVMNGDHALTEALRFGATSAYYNFAWWHPKRMGSLLRRAMQSGIEPHYSERLLRARGLDPATHEPGTLAIHCLGRFEIMVNDKLIPAAHWRGHSAGTMRMQRLLLYLARHREPQSIEMIARYIWPNTWDSIDVPNNFHITLAGLRRVLEQDIAQGSESTFVLRTPQGYQLLPQLTVTVDLDQFLSHVRAGRIADARGDQDATRAAFAPAEQLYSGDFALAKADPGEAEDYRRSALEAMLWLAADDLRRGMFESCIARAGQLSRNDPWDTAAPALLIEAYIATGNRRAARRQYERHIKDHGEPSSEIAQLARKYHL